MVVGLDLLREERRLHVVDLEEIESPRDEQIDLRVIPSLRADVAALETVVVMVPRADVLGVGHVPRVQRGAFDRQVLVHGLSRDAAHHVHAELQAESVHRIGERAESLAAGRAREALLIGNLATVPIDAQRTAVGIAVRVGVGVEPTRIDDQGVPAGVLEVVGHEARVVQNLPLGDGGAIGIPAVPAHRRSPCFRQIIGNRHWPLLIQR